MTRPMNPTSHPSTRLRVPRNDQTIEGLKVENALLLRRLLMLITSESKFRAALELATGTPWDDVNLTDLSGKDLEEYVAGELAHGLGITLDDARNRISDNKALSNPSQIEGQRRTPKEIAAVKGGPTIGGKPAIAHIGE